MNEQTPTKSDLRSYAVRSTTDPTDHSHPQLGMCPSLLAACLRSLPAACGTWWDAAEVLVVDNASTDEQRLIWCNASSRART